MDSSGSQEKKAVPRFASFKPPAPPAAALPTEPRSTEREEKPRYHSKHRSRHRNHRDGRSRSRERRKERRERRHTSRDGHQVEEEHTTERASVPSNAVTELTKDAADLYVVDRKGDKYNVIYGTLHRYSVPRYYRVGRGRVLGLPPNYRIDRDTIGENEIVVKPETWRTDSSRGGSKSVLSGLAKIPARLLRLRHVSSPAAHTTDAEDYIPLKISRGQRANRGTSELSDTDEEKYGYRSIHGKLKPGEGIPGDLELASESGSSDEEGARADPDVDIKQRNAELYRRVEKHPTDIEAWMQLINHQEALLRGSTKESASLTAAEHKSLADIKISLYEKALKKVGRCPSRDRLLLGMLEEGAKLWDTKKLSTRWHDILKSDSQFISLWIKYLDFRQTEFLNFTYDRCLTTFIECLTLNKAATNSPEKTHVQMYLFLRLTLFLRETGHSEYAIGSWQALLEFTFFRPEGLDPNTREDEALAAFTDFWDSEIPRVGEAGAKGWKNGRTAVPDPQVFKPSSRLDPKSVIASWVRCEQEHSFNAQLPARSLDEPEDDPYRVIISSDLLPLLRLVWSPDSVHEIVDSFLHFCQLPPMISVSNLHTTGRWMGDSFLRNDLIANPYATIDDWIPNLDTYTESQAASPVAFPHHYYITTFDTYFADSEVWFSSFKPWLKATSDLTSLPVRDWVRRALRSLVEAIPTNEDLAEYTVAVEFACNGKEAKKYAKYLLKKRSSSLRLYNSYALIERRTGNQPAADHVWATAISMSKSFSEHDRINSILLWRTWIWELLEERNVAHAAHLLVSLPGNNIDLKSFPVASKQAEFSPTNLLKIRNHLSETQESALVARRPHIIIACTDLQALLLYLTNNQDLSQVIEVYKNTIQKLSSIPESFSSFQSFTLQLLHQSRARVLNHHLRTTTLYKPSYIRSILTESITAFPHNTIFLSLFASNESRFRIEDRVRDTMRQITTNASTSSASSTNIPITSHLFSIYTELNRPIYAGSTAHSARTTFEKAIGGYSSNTSNNSSNNTAHSSLSLWKLYILFEISQNEINRAKGIFYRAMRACPWSKDLIMLAFTHLRADIISKQGKEKAGQHAGSPATRKPADGMSFDELRRVFNVLIEKELRIHVDIEHQLDELASTMEQNGAPGVITISMPDDQESGDEEMQM